LSRGLAATEEEIVFARCTLDVMDLEQEALFWPEKALSAEYAVSDVSA